MTRQKKIKHLEKKGYKVTIFMSGRGCTATKSNRTTKGTSITALHKKIFNY